MCTKIDMLSFFLKQCETKMRVDNLYHLTQILFAYNNNAIEGSHLTEEQTRHIYETNTILFKQDTIANLDDITETVNHFKLVDFMLDKAKATLTEKLIKDFHKILKANTSDSMKDWFNVGEYKQLSNEVGGTKTTSPKLVAAHMEKLLNWYNSLKTVTIKEIIEFHARLEKIHPFQDGNGRIGRIIMFKECLKHNIVPFIILDEKKLFYYRGLKEYLDGGEKGYLIETCLDAQDSYAKMIEKFLK